MLTITKNKTNVKLSNINTSLESMDKALPKGWKKIKLGEVVSALGDGLHGTPTYSDNGEYFFINGNNLDNGKIIIKEGTKKVSLEEFNKYKKPLNDSSILVSINGTLGNVAFYNNENVILGKSACYFNLKNEIDKLFTFYLLQTNYFTEYAKNIATGSTIKNVGLKSMREFVIPIPPLPTQQKIVAKIEQLFIEVDAGITKLKTAQKQISLFKQSVLKDAFTPKKGEEWEVKRLSEISNVVRGGSPRPAGDLKFYEGDIPFLKVADLTKDDNKYLTNFTYTIKPAGLIKTRKIFPNTLLLTNSGATLGVPKISAIEATMNDGVAAFLDLDKRSNDYVYYFLLSKTDELRKVNQGAAQPNLNTDIIKNIELPYCSFENQKKVVRHIEKQFEVNKEMEQAISMCIKEAELLKQSILKQAFEGALVK